MKKIPKKRHCVVFNNLISELNSLVGLGSRWKIPTKGSPTKGGLILSHEMDSTFPNITTMDMILYQKDITVNTSGNNDNIAVNSSQAGDYLGSYTRFVVYNAVRFCQIVIGIAANALTLLILKRLRHRLNVHIIMAYLATSDMLVSCMLPITTYLDASKIELMEFENFWDKICIIKEFCEMVFMIICIFSYLLLSFDR